MILRPHWKYLIKRKGTCHYCMCYIGSKNAAPQLHADASTWSSCVKLPVQRILMGISAKQGLNLFGGDATVSYSHSPAHNQTYLTIQLMIHMLTGTNENLIGILIVIMYCLFVIDYKDILKVENVDTIYS